MTPYLQIITTTESREDAERIARALVERRLAACAQISGPIESVYWWEGRVETAREWRCALKTSRTLFARAEEAIRSLHAYSVPQIIALEIAEGGGDYLAWLKENLAGE